jgi:hypothetical protein
MLGCWNDRVKSGTFLGPVLSSRFPVSWPGILSLPGRGVLPAYQLLQMRVRVSDEQIHLPLLALWRGGEFEFMSMGSS